MFYWENEKKIQYFLQVVFLLQLQLVTIHKTCDFAQNYTLCFQYCHKLVRERTEEKRGTGKVPSAPREQREGERDSISGKGLSFKGSFATAYVVMELWADQQVLECILTGDSGKPT